MTRIKKLGRLFEDHQNQLYLSAIAITKNRALAEDAVHDGLIAVAQSNGRIKNLKAYLFTTVRNKAKFSMKYDNKHEEYIEEFLDIEDFNADQQIFAIQILKQLNNLHPNQQQVIILKVFADLTFKEIAQITDTSQNTVASWYRRGISVLQDKHHEYK
jgi:RNA polymerase sigma-70 factor (ECF subfamily)